MTGAGVLAIVKALAVEPPHQEPITVTATRQGRRWKLAAHVPELAAVVETWVRRLEQAPAAIGDLLTAALGDAVGPVPGRVVVNADLPPSLTRHITETRQALAAIDEATTRFKASGQATAAMLDQLGLPQRDIGYLLGISHARAGRLLYRSY